MFRLLHFICRSDWAPGLPSSPELNWRPTDWHLKRTMQQLKKKPRHWTKVVTDASSVTPILLINNIGQNLKNWTILWNEKKNQREKALERHLRPIRRKILLWILLLVNAPCQIIIIIIYKYLSSKLNQPSQWTKNRLDISLQIYKNLMIIADRNIYLSKYAQSSTYLHQYEIMEACFTSCI